MLKKAFDYLKSLRNNQKGQGMVEYGLIIALVSIAVLATLGTLGGQLDTTFTDIVTALTP